MRSTKYIYPCITLALFTILVSFQLYKAFTTSLYFDDAGFAACAKNLVLGNGYSVILFNSIIPFHWEISLGPVVILPAALLIALFGNMHWVPGLTSVLLITALLVLALYQLKRIAPVTVWQCAAFFLLLVMLLSNHEIGPPENMLIWHALLGEVPSALLVIIATLYIAAHRHNPKTAFVGGIIAGLGALCKLLAIIGCGGLGLYLAVSYLMVQDKMQMPLRQALKNLFLYGAGVLLPLVSFEAVKLACLGVHGYLKMMGRLASSIQLYNSSSVGTSAIYNKLSVDMSFNLGKLYVLGQYLGIFPNQLIAPTPPEIFFVVLLVTAFPTAVVYCFFRFRGRLLLTSPIGWAAGALLCCMSAHMLWYLLISSALMPRYLTQGIFYGCAGAALLIGQITYEKPYKGNIVFTMLALLLLYGRSDAAEYFWTDMKSNEDLAETQQVLQRLIALQNKEPDTLIFSCGDAYEIEYLLPKAANFILCDKMIDPAFAHHKHILLTYNWLTTGKAFCNTPDSNRVILRENPDTIKKLCPKNDIYSGKHYFIASCHNP